MSTPSASLDASSTLLAELPSRVSTPDTTASSDAAPRKKELKEQRAREAAEKKAARKAEREAAAGGGGGESKPKPAPLRFKPREWAVVEGYDQVNVQGNEVSIMTWNILAQALVRRELFPNSDMLKIKDRIPSLMQEVLHYSPDIVALQEVDRLSDHLPSLTLTHGYTSYIGYPNKSHGLLIAHKNDMFKKVGEVGIRLDELPIFPSSSSSSSSPSHPPATQANDASLTHATDYDGSSPTSKAARKAAGLSRSTRNVGLFVALKFKGREGGVIVGTTHLFWHPQHVYERVRQTGILMREARKFRDQGGKDGEWSSWPLFLAGDFNSQPRELTYSLLSHLPLTSIQLSELSRSSVIHQSVDLLHDPTYVAPAETEEQKTAVAHSVRSGKPLSEDEDKVIKNCREGVEGDGLAGIEELKRLFGYSEEEEGQPRVRSAYGEIGGSLQGGKGEGNHYCDRLPEVQSGNGWVVKEDQEVVRKRKEGTQEERVRRGDYEPMWTNFTPLWRLSIDYIFLLPPSTLPPSSSPSPASSSSSPALTNGTSSPSSSSSPPTSEVPKFTALLLTHPTADLGLGLPRLGVCGSDHVALGCRVTIP